MCIHIAEYAFNCFSFDIKLQSQKGCIVSSVHDMNMGGLHYFYIQVMIGMSLLQVLCSTYTTHTNGLQATGNIAVLLGADQSRRANNH